MLDSVNITAIPLESILRVQGIVALRRNPTPSKSMPTGAIEIVVGTCEIVNEARVKLPLHSNCTYSISGILNSTHRYNELRSERMQHTLRCRSNFLMRTREYLINYLGFVEIETPFLVANTLGVEKHKAPAH